MYVKNKYQQHTLATIPMVRNKVVSLWVIKTVQLIILTDQHIMNDTMINFSMHNNQHSILFTNCEACSTHTTITPQSKHTQIVVTILTTTNIITIIILKTTIHQHLQTTKLWQIITTTTSNIKRPSELICNIVKSTTITMSTNHPYTDNQSDNQSQAMKSDQHWANKSWQHKNPNMNS